MCKPKPVLKGKRERNNSFVAILSKNTQREKERKFEKEKKGRKKKKRKKDKKRKKKIGKKDLIFIS